MHATKQHLYPAAWIDTDNQTSTLAWMQPEPDELGSLIRARIDSCTQPIRPLVEAVVRYFCSTTHHRPSWMIFGMCRSWTLRLAHELYCTWGTLTSTGNTDELFDVSALPTFECKLSSRQLSPHFIPTRLINMCWVANLRNWACLSWSRGVGEDITPHHPGLPPLSVVFGSGAR
jgi:hypothetical protein